MDRMPRRSPSETVSVSDLPKLPNSKLPTENAEPC